MIDYCFMLLGGVVHMTHLFLWEITLIEIENTLNVLLIIYVCWKAIKHLILNVKKSPAGDSRTPWTQLCLHEERPPYGWTSWPQRWTPLQRGEVGVSNRRLKTTSWCSPLIRHRAVLRHFKAWAYLPGGSPYIAPTHTNPRNVHRTTLWIWAHNTQFRATNKMYVPWHTL